MTLEEQLTKAQEKLRAVEDKFDRYNGNNPDKYQSEIKQARNNVARIKRAMEDGDK